MSKLKLKLEDSVGLTESIGGKPEEKPDEKPEEKPIEKPIELSDKIKEKYSFKENTFSVVAKDNPKDLVLVEVGDIKQKDFYPQMKVQRWDNETNFSARLVHDEKNPKITTDGDKIQWKGKKVEANFYEITPCEEHPEGGYEFDITIPKKPDSDVVQFTIQTKGLDFFYQPALTEEEIAQGAERPEDVVGSYAIYTSEQKTNWKGGKEYKTGKVGHIFRPKIYDSRGAWVWGDLNIDKEAGILSVTIPHAFLLRAVYPIRHAAGLTFGYTGTGGSTYTGIGQNFFGFMSGTPADSASVDSVSVRSRVGSGTVGIKSAIFTKTSNTTATLLTNGVAPEVTINTTAGWWTSTYVSKPSVLASTVYWIVYYMNNATTYYYYDSGQASGTGGYGNAGGTYATPANITSLNISTHRVSIYATYTASGGTAWNKSLTDSVISSDAISKGLGLTKSDSTTIIDDKSSQGGSNITRADSVVVTEEIVNSPTSKQADSVTPSDVIILRPTVKLSETITLSDAIVNAFHISKADSVTVIDQPTVAGTLYQNISDSVSISDAITTKGLTLTESDSITITDLAEKTMILIKADTSTVTDAYSKGSRIFENDSVGISDTSNSTFSGQLTQGLSDTALITDEITPIVTFNLTIADGVTLEDSCTPNRTQLTGNYMVYEDGKLKIIVNGSLVQQYG